MVRPSASDYNKRIGLTFANTVLADASPSSVVCRSGYCSVYSVLRLCCPSAIRNEEPLSGRSGMTEIEFNKLLEQNGFRKARSRKSMLDRHDEWTPVVRYMYAARRWRNPALPEDRARLVQGWEQLVSNAGTFFAMQCPLDRFLDLCQQSHRRWEAFSNGASQLDEDDLQLGILRTKQLDADGCGCKRSSEDEEEAESRKSPFSQPDAVRSSPAPHSEQLGSDDIDSILDHVTSGIAPADIEEYLREASIEDDVAGMSLQSLAGEGFPGSHPPHTGLCSEGVDMWGCSEETWRESMSSSALKHEEL